VRARFTEGQFLRAADLAVEQAHRENAARRHRIGGHAWGVIAGLRLVPGRLTVTVTPGLAVDGHGRILVVAAPVELALAGDAGERDVWVTSAPAAADLDGRPTEGGEVTTVCLGPAGAVDPYRPAGRPTPDPSSAVGPALWPWPVHLGRVTWTTEDVTASAGARVLAGLRGDVVAAPSGRARLRLGEEPLEQELRFAVDSRQGAVTGGSEAPDGGKPPAPLVNRMSLDRDGALSVPGTTRLRGDVLVEPTPGMATGSHRGIRFGEAETPHTASPWSFYRTRGAGTGRPVEQFRIEVGSPAPGGDPARNVLVIGAGRRVENPDGAGEDDDVSVFRPCLSVDAACTVTVSGRLEVRGLLSRSPIRADRADPRFAGAAAERFVQGAVGTANQLDAFYASRLTVAVTPETGEFVPGPVTSTVTVRNVGSVALTGGQIHVVVGLGGQAQNRTAPLITGVTLAPGASKSATHTFTIPADTTATKLTLSVLAVAVGPASNVVSATANSALTIVKGGPQ
jgi:hypothetical protein